MIDEDKDSEDSTIVDVVIIGAGLSGLYAAYTILLTEETLDVLILEASDRIGGRTLSLPLKINKEGEKCTFDLGAHWVSSSQDRLINLIHSFNLTLIRQRSDGVAIGIINDQKPFSHYTKNPIFGGLYTKYEIKWFFAKMEEMCMDYFFTVTSTRNETKTFDYITMEEFIETNLMSTDAKEIVKNIIKITCGLDASKISVMFYLILCNSNFGFTNQYLTTDNGSKECWIKEGAQDICYYLEDFIGKNNIILSEKVTEIIQAFFTETAYLKTLSGKIICCRNIICAIPPNQVQKINFQPALFRNLRAIFEHSHKGGSIQFVITYSKKFWRAQGYSGEIFCCSGGPIKMCHDATKYNHPALIGYIIEDINNFDLKVNGSYKYSVIKQLIYCYGPEAANPLDYVEYFWSLDSMSGGSPMCCPGIGNINGFYDMVVNPFGKVHWAGAETSLIWYGTMNGALESGYRAALYVLYNLRPQATDLAQLYNTIRMSHKTTVRITNRSKLNKFGYVFGFFGVCFILYKIYKNTNLQCGFYNNKFNFF